MVANACLWADLDEGGDEALAKALVELERGELLPTLIVRSSPGKHHLWWRLDEPAALGDADARRAFESALVGLAGTIGGDGAVVDCSRVLRLPGSRNVKPWYAEPAPVELIEAHADRAYPLARLAGLVAPPPPKPARAGKRPVETPTEDARAPHGGLPHLDRCAFVRDCREQATTLSEPLWADLAWTLAPSGPAGDAAFHDLSRAPPTYDRADADAKLRFAREHGYHPPTHDASRNRHMTTDR